MKSAKQWFDVAFDKDSKEFFFSGLEGEKMRGVFVKIFEAVQEDALHSARLIVVKARKKFTKEFTRALSPEADLFAEEFKDELDKLLEKIKPS